MHHKNKLLLKYIKNEYSINISLDCINEAQIKCISRPNKYILGKHNTKLFNFLLTQNFNKLFTNLKYP